MIVGGIVYLLTSLFDGWAPVYGTLAGVVAVLLPARVILKTLLVDKVVIIEGEAYLKAITRSWNLMSGRVSDGWPKTYLNRFAMLLLLYLFISMAINMVLAVPAKLVGVFASPGSFAAIAGAVVGQIGEAISNTIAGIFFSVSAVVFYYDVRTRKEGFDLEMLVSSYGEENNKG